jgi:PAP2 superfamily
MVAVMRRSTALLVNTLVISCCLAESSRETHREERLPGSVIVQWNQLAYEIAFAEDQFTTFKGQRALAMTHLAQHDALNTIVRRFESYAAKTRRVPQAEPTAAAAQAARQVLIAQYPAAQSEIDALLAQQLASIAGDPRRRDLGIDVGRAAAAAILELRNRDGWEVAGAYEFFMAPGAYQTTPPWQGLVLHPGLANAKPFMLNSAAQVRPPAPPPLQSRAYARAFEEVKKFGSHASSVRTADQTAYAIWWMEFSEGLVNRLARRLANEKKLELWETARLFALMNAALVDTYVAVWDSKYAFNHWRPYTAIRQATSDGNSRTQPDLQWESLRPAPPFPEYVSAHAAGCACTFAILAREFGGRNMPLTLDSLTAPPGMPTRSFKSFGAAADECADSRVRLGFHFRYSTDAGQKLGWRTASYAMEHYLKRDKENKGSAD